MKIYPKENVSSYVKCTELPTVLATCYPYFQENSIPMSYLHVNDLMRINIACLYDAIFARQFMQFLHYAHFLHAEALGIPIVIISYPVSQWLHSASHVL